ncbi:hypothetical protein B0T26DRAFT_801396 [Lasiosphaeria miniovina]|uniref:Peptidase S8/S53 domain-containing protein n=1 Tax=Lasiosphaeria miniovina TaxID=1954250 RepID=A0AA40AVF6_9PEZI|nr:uncharacterized protein B0T26DRAFT_801396 [Lasiosphaeria miniovina]KAK0722684.1 hypothetical protein B0T26DRAFT_801396 [Lasiosphaeria miniovina]
MDNQSVSLPLSPPLPSPPPPLGYRSPDATPAEYTADPQQWEVGLENARELGGQRLDDAALRFEEDYEMAKAQQAVQSGVDAERERLLLILNSEIKAVAQDLLAAIMLALEQGAQEDDIEILYAKQELAAAYTDCEEFDKAEEQYTQTLSGLEKNRLFDDLLHCRRTLSRMLRKVAVTRRDPQSTRVRALSLVMQNINQEESYEDPESLENDIKLCDILVMNIINCTENHAQDKIVDPTGAASWGHVGTLQRTAALLATSVKEAGPMLTTLLLQVKIRTVQLLAVDLKAWGRAREVHAGMNEIRNPLSLHDITDDRLKVALQRTLADLEYWDESLQLEMYVYMRQQKAKQMWLTALTVIRVLSRWRKFYQQRKAIAQSQNRTELIDTGEEMSDVTEVKHVEDNPHQSDALVTAQAPPKEAGQRIEETPSADDDCMAQPKEEVGMPGDSKPEEYLPKEEEEAQQKPEDPLPEKDELAGTKVKDEKHLAEKACLPEDFKGEDKTQPVGRPQYNDETRLVDESFSQHEKEELIDEDHGLTQDESSKKVKGETQLAEAQPRDQTQEMEKTRWKEEERHAEAARLAQEAREVEHKVQLRLYAEGQEKERLAQEDRLAKEARMAEEVQRLENAERQEQERLAQEIRVAEEIRLAEEARKAEESRLAEERRRSRDEAQRREKEAKREEEEERLAEETRLLKEAQATNDGQLKENALPSNENHRSGSTEGTGPIEREQKAQGENNVQPELLDSIVDSLARRETGFTEVFSDGEEDDDELATYTSGKVSGTLFDANHAKSSKLSTQWIETMKEFSSKTLANTNASYPLRARVAVIDTGISADHPKISKLWQWSAKGGQPADRPSRFRDFSERKPGDDEQGEPTDPGLDVPVDEDGHGTFIAGLLLNLVPGLELSVARIGKTRSSIQNDDPEHLSYRVGKAIEYAVKEWKSEIISISFGCEKSAFVTRKLKEAIYHDVIVLAATGNSGNSKIPPFPAMQDGVFKVYSCTAFARADETTGTPWDSINSFHTLGRDIESIWPGHLAKNAGDEVQLKCKTARKTKSAQAEAQAEHSCSSQCNTSTVMSGTSFATPIAAAMVAIVYQFYNTHRDQIDLRLLSTADKLKTINSSHSLSASAAP